MPLISPVPSPSGDRDRRLDSKFWSLGAKKWVRPTAPEPYSTNPNLFPPYPPTASPSPSLYPRTVSASSRSTSPSLYPPTESPSPRLYPHQPTASTAPFDEWGRLAAQARQAERNDRGEVYNGSWNNYGLQNTIVGDGRLRKDEEAWRYQSTKRGGLMNFGPRRDRPTRVEDHRRFVEGQKGGRLV